MASAIPAALRDEVEQDTGCVIAAERARGGGGASRQGAEVTLRAPSGTERRCYLAWDARAGEPARLDYFRREAAILAALSGPLRSAGVKVAGLIGAYPSHLALLSQFVAGNDRFAQAGDKAGLAREFVEQLAALHSLDARLPEFAVLGDANEAPAQRIRANLANWTRQNLASGPDPILQLALLWLSRNIPQDIGPAAVLHGDAGPGNFIFADDRIAALVDWELTHLGDPAEDLAQIWVRSLIQPFVPIRDIFASYEAATGRIVDVARVKFHRLYFQLSFSVSSAALASAPGSRLGASGTALMFGTMHRRVMVRALAELAGIALADPILPECDADWTDRTFAAALDDLKSSIVPLATDQLNAAQAKDLARLVKFWRRRASHGKDFDATELDEIKAVMRTAPDDLAGARAALAEAIAADAIDFAGALQLCHNRMVRETFVMAEAMGALATTWYDEAVD